MNRRISLAAGLLLTAAVTAAREPLAPPSPYGAAPTSSLFIGHYGQALEFPSGWAAEAEMRGEAEIVHFHRAFVNGDPTIPFNPKPSEYTLGKFASMGLMELVVIPKDARGGMRSLEALREAKERTLNANGVAFELRDADGRWPSGTFHVEASKPHRYSQTYSQTSKRFYIFTTSGGRGDEAGDFLRRSLAASLLPGGDAPARRPILPFALPVGFVLAAAYLIRKKVTR